MCQVFIGKIISGEMRVVELQLSSARFAERYSKAHRRAAVLAHLQRKQGEYHSVFAVIPPLFSTVSA